MTYFGGNNIPFFLLCPDWPDWPVHSWHAYIRSGILFEQAIQCQYVHLLLLMLNNPLHTTHTTHIAAHLCLDLFLFFSLLHGSSIGIPFSILCFIYILIYCFFCFQCVVELCMDTNRGMWRVACRVIAYHKRFCNQELAETMSAKARL